MKLSTSVDARNIRNIVLRRPFVLQHYVSVGVEESVADLQKFLYEPRPAA